jgi:hypothetical protein
MPMIGRYQSYLGLPAADAAVSQEAAAAAAHDVLAHIYPARPASFDEALSLTLATVPAGSKREAGLAEGRKAAQAALSRPLFLGPEPEPYRPGGEVGELRAPDLACLRTVVHAGAAVLSKELGRGDAPVSAAAV